MDVIESLEGRRSINFFDPERKIEPDVLRRLLETANLSPSTGNLQPWEAVVVEDAQRKKALRECANGQPKAEEASAVIIVIADPGAVETNIDDVLETAVRLGYTAQDKVAAQKGYYLRRYEDKEGLARKFFAVKNASFFAMSLMAAARGLGLETHPMDGFDEAKVKAEFGIPGDRIIPVLIAVGYPKPGLKLLPRAFRRPLERFVHFNRY